jgi:hypothetical protein
MTIRDEYWDLFPAGELQSLCGKLDSRPANLAEFFDECPDSILKIFQSASEVSLTEAQGAIAKAEGLAVAKDGRPTIAALVERWSSNSELKDFAAAVRRTLLPG